MKIELLLLIEEHTDTLIDQPKTKPQETLEYKMNKQMQTFPFNPPINLVDKKMATSSYDYLRQPILFSI